MSLLLFTLSQNWNGEYSNHQPFQTIKLASHTQPLSGYSICDEYGRTDFLPGNDNGESLFLPADEDTELAFIGPRKIQNNLSLCVVKLDETCKVDIQRLLDERVSWVDYFNMEEEE
jgi:hypothetical protein